jgi:hypothetical protein
MSIYKSNKDILENRRNSSLKPLQESCRLYKFLKLPLIPDEAAKILREADRRSLLGSHLMVVGTNAMAAYALQAAGMFDVMYETQDFDLTWVAIHEIGDGTPIWDMLNAVDPTYTVNTERPFQARNAKAYEVEILAAPSRISHMERRDRPRPVALPEQEWLLNGRVVEHVVVARDGSPARLVVPDPRWFALQKMWLSEKKERNPSKIAKDARQGVMLLDAVDDAMLSFPLDDEFEKELPEELKPYYYNWKNNKPIQMRPLPSW